MLKIFNEFLFDLMQVKVHRLSYNLGVRDFKDNPALQVT